MDDEGGDGKMGVRNFGKNISRRRIILRKDGEFNDRMIG
jgi:hypothetical protein